jgi:hypothetical protein
MPRRSLLPLLLACASLLPAKTFVAERYDVRVRVLPDTSLKVTETVRFRFEGESFHFVSREVSKRGTDGIYDITAAMDGAPVTPEVEENAGRIKVTWHFDAAADTVHDFALEYRVKGAIGKDADRDTLLWHAIPERHDYTILAGGIEVEYPPEAPLISQPAVPQAVSAGREEGRAMFTLPRLSDDTGASLRVEFQPGFVSAAPAWQAREADRRKHVAEAWNTGLIAALGGCVIGILILLRLRASIPPDAQPMPQAGSDAAPAGLPPAVAARLAGQSPGVHAALGTVFDLARRGVLAIRDGEKGTFGGRKYYVEPRDLSQPLLPFERNVVKLAFDKDSPQPPEFSSFLNKLSTAAGGFGSLLEEHMVSIGFLDQERIRVRKRWLTISLVLTFAGLIVAVVAGGIASDAAGSGEGDAVRGAAAVAGAAAAMFLVGIFGIVVSCDMSPLTSAGAATAGASRKVKQNLTSISQRKQDARPDAFEQWLPFAAALGLGAAWAKRFRNESGVPPPEWFVGDAAAFETMAFMDFVAAGSASADTSVSSVGGSGGGSSTAG